MADPSEEALAINLDGALWIPYKELFRIVNSAVYKKDLGTASIQDLEATLRTYKMDFIRLLKNPLRSKKSRAAVEKATTDGICVVGQQGKRILTQAVVDEALILSDLFEVNEVVALELLLMGESEQPRLATATRGLAAVLLFYEGRLCLVNSLRTLIQAREGRCWTLALPDDVTEAITKFTDDLWEAELCNRIFSHLESSDLEKEREHLEKSRALGDPKHRKQVLDLVEEIHASLAECVYCWASQSGLSRPLFVRLLNVLAGVTPRQRDSQLDGAQFALLMAAFYSIDVGMLASTEDSDEKIQNFPLLADADFAAGVHKELTSANAWKCPAMKAAVQLAWAVALRTMAQLPNFQGQQQYPVEEDEALLDFALEGGAFNFITTMVIGNEHFFDEEFYVRRLHGLITDFIVLFPLKVKELRNRGDEIARIVSQGDQTLDGSLLPMLHFQHLLELVTLLYSKDPLNLELNEQFWCSSDVPGQLRGPSATFSNPSPKQVNLFKFVRLAGDLIPPFLYVHYIRMLCSLSSSPAAAHHCFSLLKSNVSLSTGSGHYGVVSWDHFFVSLHRYFLSLCHEPVGFPQQPPQRGRAITPQEVEGLQSVLQLIQTIAQHDDVARLSIMSEALDWSPLAVLLGLLSCAIPLTLKAQIVSTISSLVKSYDVALAVWHALEESHMLPTAADSAKISTVQMELEEVESHCEVYPLTNATLGLLSAFVDTFQSVDSSGQKLLLRFEPSMLYAIGNVFANFHLRPYKCPEEKWQIASTCLNLFLKLASKYELSASHFKKTADGAELDYSSSGYLIVSHMLQDSSLLKTVLYIVEEVACSLDQYLPNFTGKKEMEASALLCLKLIQISLEKQETFVAAVRESSSTGALIPGLDQLLMGVNPRTNRADFVPRIAKFISFSSLLPEQAFYASNVLLQLCHMSISQEKLVGTFCTDDVELDNLRSGLVECLEYEDPDEEMGTCLGFSADSMEDVSRLRSSTRRTVLRMLIYCQRYPPPNFSLFLLGFGLAKTPQKTILQDPGVLGSPFTCLHAVLEILFRLNSDREYPMTAELCQELVYTLSTNPDTSGPTLRYLRTSHDFLYRQLKTIPFGIEKSDEVLNGINLLNQQAWLLKTVAVELRVTAASGQRSSLIRLVSLLIDDKATAGLSQISCSRSKLLGILDVLQLSNALPLPPQWELYDGQKLESVIASCERPTHSGFTVVDIPNLHRLLSTEINRLQGSLTLGQRPAMTKELDSILNYVARRNRARLQLHAKRQALESWRLVTEMVLSTINADFLDEFRRITIILELAHTVLHKVLDDNSSPELANPTSRVLPTLFASLRQCFLSDKGAWQQSKRASWKPHSSSLEVALRNLIECILKAGVGPHKVRANYYCALLNLLKVCATSDDDVGDKAHEAETDDSDGETFLQKNMDSIYGYGNGFPNVLCRDACNNNDITKMLAICCLSFLVSKDHRQILVNYMASNGYVQEFVNGLKVDEAHMCSNSPENASKLYVYEIKMAFFVRLASNGQGVRHLSGSGLLKYLTEMQMFKIRPDIFCSDASGEANRSVANAWFDWKNSFHHILVPALRICLLLLTSITGNVLDSRSQVIHFLVSHVDLLSTVLSECQHSVIEMKEISLILAIFANVYDVANDYLNGSNASAEVQTNLSRLYRLAKSCLPALVAMKKASDASGPQQRRADKTDKSDEEETAWMESVGSVMHFCTNVVKVQSKKRPMLVFGPYMSGNPLADSYLQEHSRSSRAGCRMPDLSLLVYLVRHSMGEYFSVFNNQHVQESSLLTWRSIWQVGEQDTTPSAAGPSPKRVDAKKRDLIIHLIENALYLLWFHLEFYLSRGYVSELNTSQSGIRRLNETSISGAGFPSNDASLDGGIPFCPTSDDLAKLRNDCKNVLTDSFLERLREVIQCLDRSRQGHFLSVIMRRLRWLAVTPAS